MKSLGPRNEVGLLEFGPSPPDTPKEATIRVLARGFLIRTFETYSSPVDMKTSAIRFDLDIGELCVCANAFPCHVAVRFAGQQYGDPEFYLQEYRKNHV
jgi:hypothetical protein